MTKPVFVDGVTEIPASFANTVASLVYDVFGQAATVVQAQQALGLGTLAIQNATNVAFAGGTMDGVVIGSVNPVAATFTTASVVDLTPTAPQHLTTKQYVDGQISNIANAILNSGGAQALLAGKVNRAGDTMTGPLYLYENPLTPTEAANKAYVDAASANLTSFIGNLAMQNNSAEGAALVGYRNQTVWAALDTLHFTPINANLIFAGPSVAPSAVAGFRSLVMADLSFAGQANGLATLDSTGHIPLSQIPASIVGALQFEGLWNASTNSPTLASGVGTKGYFYTVSVAGTTTLDGVSNWQVGDQVFFNGTAWEKLATISGNVLSVAGRTGNVVLAYTDISGLSTVAHSGSFADLTNVPIATPAALGLVQIGTGLSITAQGVLSGNVGTVTSVGLTMPTMFTVANTPISSSGNINVTLANQNANLVFAGPATGAPAAPAFRALVPADLPIATAAALGVVSAGAGLSITGGGALSANMLSFNGRTGATTLTYADVETALGVTSTPQANQVLSYTSSTVANAMFVTLGNATTISASFNPATTGSNITLSDSNLAAAITASGQTVTFNNVGVSTSGKYYFEVEFVSGTASSNAAVGVVPASELLNVQIGYNDAGSSAGIFQNSGNIYVNGSATVAGSAQSFSTPGQIVCVAYDASTRNIWFRVNNGNWNGSAGNSPASGTGGIAVGGTGAVFAGLCSDSVSSWLATFAGGFAYTLPAGFTAWPGTSQSVTSVTPHDVNITNPTAGQILWYNGITWINQTPNVNLTSPYPQGITAPTADSSPTLATTAFVHNAISAAATGGTVTSVGLSMPSIFAVSGSPVTSSGTLAATLNTQTANTVFAGPTNGSPAAPAFRALVIADLPAGTGTVTSVGLSLPASLFTVTNSPVTSSGTLTGAFVNQSANVIFAGPTTGTAAPTFRSLALGDLPSGYNAWSGLTSPSGNLSLTMGAYTSTFNSSLTGTGFAWQQSTAAISGTNQNSMALALGGTYWTGAASGNDVWTIQDVVGAGTNPSSTLTFAHSGSTGTASVQVPNLIATNAASITNTTNGQQVIQLVGNGATTPNKYLGVSNGTFSLTASDGTTTIFSVSDGGGATLAGGIIVTGTATLSSGGTSTTAALGSNSTQIATTAYVFTATQGNINVTLTGNLTLTASQYSYPLINFSGSLGAPATVTLPGNGSWKMYNNSGAAVTLTNGSSPTVLLQNGQSLSIVAFSGIGVFASGPSDVLTVGSTITTASGTLTPIETYQGVNFAGAVTVNLPAGSSVTKGKTYIIKDESGAAATNNITVARNGTDTIDGQTSAVIATNHGSLTLLWTGSGWSIV